MEEKIQKLYCSIRDIGATFLFYHKRNNVEEIKKIMPEIQEFILWFLEGNRFGIEEELYQNMCCNLLDILEDIVQALEQHDVVLLHDAATNGLLEYLGLFMDLEQEESTNDNV